MTNILSAYAAKGMGQSEEQGVADGSVSNRS